MRNATLRTLPLGLLLLLVPTGAPAQEAVWKQSCRFVVEVDGRPAPDAAVFEQQGVRQLLGRFAGGTWFVVDPAQQVVKALDQGAVDPRGDRDAVIVGTIPPDGRRLTLTPSGLTFDVNGKWLRILVTPELLGEVTPEQFLALCPDFVDREREYQPDPETVRSIAACGKEIDVEIYFGSWCPHCQEVLPKLFKCLRLADNPKVQVRMIGLPRGFGAEPEVRARKVTGVPTVIIMDQGVELGRFSGTGETPIEKSLADLLPG